MARSGRYRGIGARQLPADRDRFAGGCGSIMKAAEPVEPDTEVRYRAGQVRTVTAGI